ncbi:MAG: hypothetical protein GX270_14160 [Clostridiaceae bacterium]|nr:hypothetical protein [Clostridiaceae bacterium]
MQNKLKVSFFDTQLIKSYLAVLSVISLIFSFVLIVIELPDDIKIKVLFGVGMLLVFLSIYIGMWISANWSKHALLKINNSSLEVKIGDIFSEDALKVIAFNEYFDTQVDNVIIAENTLNGIFLKSKVENIKEFNSLINKDKYLENKIIENKKNRPVGKKKRYKIGTIFQYKDYLLTAMTKFDDNNRAYLYMQDYINFLINFWNEIDIIYAGRSVAIPLLGSGITRFKEFNTISEQELLEIIIWSFKISRIKFTYPSKVSIIIHKSKLDKINFYKLKGDNENGLQD